MFEHVSKIYLNTFKFREVEAVEPDDNKLSQPVRQKAKYFFFIFTQIIFVSLQCYNPTTSDCFRIYLIFRRLKY